MASLIARTNPNGQFLIPAGIHWPDEETHFNLAEFRCRCGHCTFSTVAQRLIVVLEAIRQKTGPLHIASGIRCKEHNARIGGAARSKHVPEFNNGIGIAADVVARNKSPEDLAILGARELGNDGGIGVYSGWVHFDVRSAPAFWRG